MRSEASTSGPGRPRRPGADEAILHATLELLAEVGLAGTTVGEVATRAGVARATVYLRWPTREALLAASARYALGREPLPLTGDIEADVRAGAREAAAAFRQATFVAILPEVVAALTSGSREIDFDEVAPIRRRFAELYRRSATAQGFRTDVDASLAIDLLIGAVLSHLLATGAPPSRAAAERMADVVVQGLREGAVGG